ncbi:MAG TPA: PQQ-dependent sugar dehydrogenase [Solirubrobacteraceae bacterium]|nr:PQQ-dependent sugar dehydrogenase [Solirubrobacteraceae bacterium]
MPRIAIGSVVVVTVALAIVACGGDSSGGDGTAATAAAATTATGAAAAAAGTGARAQAAGGVKLVPVGTFDTPVYVTAPPGDRRRIFVVQQGGTIRVVRAGHKLAKPFLDVRSRVISGGEQGLLSMAFAPDYATTRRFYVNYTDKSGKQRIVEYRASKSDPDVADAASARLVLRYDGIEPNHNGGLLVFGPDKLLYAGTGDGGGENDQHGAHGNSQDLSKLEGKLLRIDPRRSGTRPYTVPASNPFVGRAGARPEVYSYGLRNPWRFSFDRRTGDLAIGDVGQDHVEEIDFARKGGARGVNYGWRPLEGTRVNYPGETAPGAVAPVLQMLHSDGNCSVTGGYVVRDPKLPALAGRYVYGDYCKGDVRSVRLGPGTATGDSSTGLHVDQLSSFGEDALGRVYVVSLAGAVSRLAAG